MSEIIIKTEEYNIRTGMDSDCDAFGKIAVAEGINGDIKETKALEEAYRLGGSIK